MSGKRSRKANKIKRKDQIRKGVLCRVKGSEIKGIYEGMDDTLAVIKTATGRKHIPFKNLERVS